MKKEKAPRQRGSTNAPKNVTRRRFKSNREQRFAARMLFTALLGHGLDAERFNRVGAIWVYSDSAFEGPEPIPGYAQ